MKIRVFTVCITFLLTLIPGYMPVAYAESSTQVSAHIDWSGINLTSSSAFTQSITPHNVPPNSLGQVEWAVHVGNSTSTYSIHFILSNFGIATFSFYDVPAGSRVENVENSSCSLQSGNAFGTPNSWRSSCVTPISVEAGETYTFNVKPFLVGGSQWFAGFLTLGSSGKVIQMGRLENQAVQAVKSQSQNMRGFNQISYSKSPLPDCSRIPDFSATFSNLSNTQGSQPLISGTRVSQNCPGLASIDLNAAGKYRVNIGNLGVGVVSENNQEILGAQKGSFYGLNIKPSRGGSLVKRFCGEGKVVTQIRMTPQTSNPFLQGFRFGCSSLNSDGGYSSLTEILEIVNSGVVETDYKVLKCPDGQGVTTIHASTLNYVRDLSITCSKIDSYKAEISPRFGVGTNLPLDSASTCTSPASKSAFLTGISAYAAAGLDSLQAICTPIENILPKLVRNPQSPSKKSSLSFSIVNFLKNSIVINVNIGTASNRPDAVYLFAPQLGIYDEGGMLGRISGEIASWTVDVTKISLGDFLNLKVVSVKDGVKSEPLEQIFKVPNLSSINESKLAPNPPTKVTSRVVGSSLLISAQVNLKSNAIPEKAYIFGNAIGIPPKKALEGEIIGTKVLFDIPVKKSMIGKTLSFTVYLQNRSGKSSPVQGSVTLPAAPKLDPGQTIIPTQPKAPQTVFCKKGNITRTFAANSCPPGWIK